MPYSYPLTPYNNPYASGIPSGPPPSNEAPRAPMARPLYVPDSVEHRKGGSAPAPFIPPYPAAASNTPKGDWPSALRPSGEIKKLKNSETNVFPAYYAGYPSQPSLPNWGDAKLARPMFGGAADNHGRGDQRRDNHASNPWHMTPPLNANLSPLRQRIAALEAENEQIMHEQKYDEERRLRHRIQELEAGNWYLKQRRAYGY